MKKTILSVVSILLTVLMIVMSCPLQAMAYFVTQTDETTVLSGETEKLDLSQVEILSEDVSKRGESQKHFKLSDGSFIAVQYSEPVHYADEEGKWIDIDNALVFDDANDNNDFDGYVNSANSFKAKFADSVEDALFYIEGSDGENKLSFELINNDTNAVEANIKDIASASIDNESSLFSRNQEMIACTNVSSEIVYDEIIDDVDFNYTVTARGIKENIIINRRLDNYSFAFSVDADGLTLTKKSDGSIVATDTENNVIYTIPAPFMYDENGRFSDAVEYTLSAKNNGKYTLSIVADKEWINNSETTFPVVIDPMVNTTDNGLAIDAAYVTSSDPDANKSTEYLMNVGKKSDGSINRIFVEMILPLTARNSVITSAQLCMYQAQKPDSTYYVELHEITEEWDSSTITWNNQPEYSNTVIGYTDVSEGSNSTFKSWDITKYAIRNEAVGYTEGFVLKATDESIVEHSQFLSNLVADQLRPYIIVNYRNQMGVEEDQSYISYDDGNSGVAYVNNYTGNMTYIKPIAVSESDVMPASLGLVYNSSMAYNRFSCSNADRLNTCAYTNMYLTRGWKLTAQQSVVPIEQLDSDIVLDDTEYTYAYIYTDEDGTEHYFYLDSSNTESVTYVDEDELGMTLTYDEANNQYVIEYEDGYTKRFKIVYEQGLNGMSNNGYLISEKDADGNTISYTYDTQYPGRLVAITDPSGTIIYLYYNTYGYLDRVVMGSMSCTMNYHINQMHDCPTVLSSISSNRNQTTYFTNADYMNLGKNELLNVTNADGSGLAFTYTDTYYDSDVYGVKIDSVVWRTGEGGGTCAAFYDYKIGQSTTVRYVGDDCITNTEDDLNFTYSFNSNGNVTTAYVENYDRSIIYSTDMYGYKSVGLNDSQFSLTSYAQTGIISENLISEINSYDSEVDFVHTEGVTYNISNSTQYAGERVFSASFSGNSDSERLYYSKNLSAGTYTFASHVNLSSSATDNAIVTVKDSAGQILGQSDKIDYITSEINNGYEKVWITFTLDEADTVTFSYSLNGGSGLLMVSHLTLGENFGYTPTQYNLLGNPGFENGMNGWNVSHDNVFSISTDSDDNFGSNAAKAYGAVDKEYTISRSYSIDAIPTYAYIVSGWAKADSVNTTDSDAKFELFAKVKYTYFEGGVVYSGEKETVIPFSSETAGWQYVSGVVELPEPEDTWLTDATVKEIVVGGRYAHNCNEVIFDNFTLVQDTATKIDYDAEGNISSITGNGDTYKYEYDDDDNLTKILKSDGTVYREYFYTDGNLTSVKDGEGNVVEEYVYVNGKLKSSVVDGVETEYAYTAWGAPSRQITEMEVDGVTKTIASTSTYNPTTKKLICETDSLYNTTSYTYNSDLLLTMIEDANSNQTKYVYTNGVLSSQFADTDKDGVFDSGESIVNYSYDSYGRVVGIETASTEYQFTYNSANLPVSVYVAGETQPLVTYLYNSNNTQNIGANYANGLTVLYEYDTLGNIKKVFKNGALAAEYEYDGNMNVITEIDASAGTKTQYLYTESGTPLSVKKQIDDYIIRTYTTYDSETNDVKYNTFIRQNGVTQTKYFYTSSYDEAEDISKYILPNASVITSDTDELGRTKNVYLKNSSGENLLTCTYAYVDKAVGAENCTSQYIASMTYTNGKSYSYTYDAVGNITSVSDGTNTTTYVYDSLYQLVRENNQKAGKTWTYTYDSAGNILSKNEYNYSTGTLGAAVDTVTYTYGNTNWGDQLTSYDGTAITYDAIGNPLNWTDGRTFTWNGRQLSSVTNASGTLYYTYNADGIRTKKHWTFDDEATETIDYILDDNNTLLGEIYTYTEADGFIETDTIYYFYDESGSPVYCKYNGATYYYVKNQQGDITGLMKPDGTMTVTYEYDAWGNLISSSRNGSDAYGLYTLNVYTYRGYIYDIDTGFYYLQSRYYDPEVGRFLNADDTNYLGATGTTLGYNLYSYCENNGVNKLDSTGYLVTSISLSLGVSFVGGFSVKAVVLFDSFGEIGVAIGITTLFGFSVKGISLGIGFYPSYYSNTQYLDAVTGTYTIGVYSIGGSIVYQYSSNKATKTRVGFEVSYGTIGIFRESSAIDGFLYIKLNRNVKEYNTSLIQKTSALLRITSKIKVRFV